MGPGHHARRYRAFRYHEQVRSRGFLLPCLLLSVIPVAAAAPPHGTVVSSQALGIVSTAEIEGQAPGFFEMYPVPPMLFAVDSFILHFTSEDFDGTAVQVKSQAFIPRGEGDLPILVFGSGTTGLADACAPSLEKPEVRRLGWYTANMLSYAAQGFIVILPDYIGFNDSARIQRYFSKAAEAHVMLDAARAAKAFVAATGGAVRAASRVFVAGYSQGGHAAFSAADLRGAYAPEVPLAGVIGFGATCDVTTLLREGPVYAPFLLYAWQQMYGTADVDPSAVLDGRWAATLETDAARMCVDEFQVYYPADTSRLYHTSFLQALNNNRVASILPRLAARLQENMAGLSGHGLPALVVQGNQDIVVTTASQDRFVAALRAAGSPVRYLALDGVRHRYTRPAGFSTSVDWMRALSRGEPAPSDGRMP